MPLFAGSTHTVLQNLTPSKSAAFIAAVCVGPCMLLDRTHATEHLNIHTAQLLNVEAYSRVCLTSDSVVVVTLHKQSVAINLWSH